MILIKQLIQDLQAQGIALWVADGRLRFRAPQGAMTAALRAQLQANKANIIAHLQQNEPATIMALPEQADYELSPAQWRLWVLTQMENSSVAYNVPLHQLIAGALDVAALQRALQQIAARHESLRTCFVLVDGEPRQTVVPSVAVELVVVDVPDEAAALQMSLVEAQRPFDLTTAPLFRAKLVRLAPQKHVLLLTLHHLICDGVSIGILNREMALLYEGMALRPLPLQYRDYAHWQNRWLAGEEAAQHRRYWLDKLGGDLPVLDLPTDFPRPVVQSFNGREQLFHFDVGTLAQMKQLARREGVTLFMLLLALLKTLLYRYTNQTDIIVGSPVAARPHAGLYDQIGFYLNTLPLRTTITPEATFAQLLEHIKTTVMGGLDHQIYPFDQLVNELTVRRDLSRAPLFDVMLVLQNQADAGMQLGNLHVQTFFQHSQTSKVDLTFQFGEDAAGLHLGIEYNSDLFAPERIERMGSHFETLVGSVLVNRERPLDQLNILPEAEQALIANFSASPLPAAWREQEQETLVSWFEAQVARTPAAVAVQFEGESLTYAALNGRANQLAHYLRQQGVAPETLIGLYLERSLEMVIAILGILKAGAAYVPFDTAMPTDRLAFMLQDTQTPLLITQDSLASQLANISITQCLITQLPITQLPIINPNIPVTPNNLAYIIYTSGSTGRPKGVMVTHGNVTRLFSATEHWYNFDEQDVWTLFHSYAFDFSVWEMWGALLYGGRLVVVPYWVSRAPAAFYALLLQEAVTVLNQTPSAFKQLIGVDGQMFEAKATRRAGDKGRRQESLALRYVIFGGEALDIPGLRPWFERHGDEKPQLVNMYGITETTVHVTYRPLTTADLASRASVIGRPIPDWQLYILDRNQQPVPIGVPGEMVVGGAGVARGYLNQAELTSERFVPLSVIGNPLSVNRSRITVYRLPFTVYRTGDLARWLPNGDVEYLGRIDTQVKIRGFRIELGEIEAVLVQCEGVDTAATAVHTDAAGDNQIVAYIVTSAEGVPATESLRGQLRQWLPEYMIPAAFVPVTAVPLTPNGKIDRQALLALGVTSPQQTEHAAPRNELEEKMAAIWTAVLELPRVGIHDNFFDLGGHSLKGMRIVARVQQEMGLTMTLLDLFRQQTVATLTAVLSQRTPIEHKITSMTAIPEMTVIPEVTDEELALLWEDEP